MENEGNNEQGEEMFTRISFYRNEYHEICPHFLSLLDNPLSLSLYSCLSSWSQVYDKVMNR